MGDVLPSRPRGGEAAVAALVERAASQLDSGQLVVLPTETVYGAAASTTSPDALAALRALQSNPGNTWHTHDRQRVIEAAGLRHPAHLRMLDRLTPGGVRFLIDSDVTRVGQEPDGLFCLDGCLCVRIPDHPFTNAVLAAAKSPITIGRVPSFISSTGRSLDAADLPAALDRAGIALAINDGPTRLGSTSTPIQLTRAGGYRVLGDGAVDRRTIDAAMRRVILFVCSGNTCRSPMAEAIARDFFEKAPPSNMPLVALSAGTTAFDGDGATAEGDQALRHLGITPRPHRSRLLTREMIQEAEAVFAMTKGHRATILNMVPEAKDKVELLAPSGKDIPDPIGSGLEVYISTAEAIRAGILHRLRERNLVETESRPGVSR
ncbi:MAG: Sua5/YciO/YrdC/YwlC family protein [Phycisphaerales bacterium]|nr:Sua5/YciO/YrdC/YwlC family protein [Phycisphaerales bacterium]